MPRGAGGGDATWAARGGAAVAAIPSVPLATLARMWLAHVVCSANDCYEELEIVTDDLAEIDRIGCDCGHGFLLLSISEVELVGL